MGGSLKFGCIPAQARFPGRILCICKLNSFCLSTNSPVTPRGNSESSPQINRARGDSLELRNISTGIQTLFGETPAGLCRVGPNIKMGTYS